MINYPTPNLDPADAAAGPRVPLMLVLGLLLAGAVGCLPTVALRAVRQRGTVGA
jgi:hypothetical protein